MKKLSIIVITCSGLTLFFIVYAAICFWYISAGKKHDRQKIVNHALIIADDLWNLNESGTVAYLNLVAHTEHYKTIEIVTDSNDIFLQLDGPAPSELDNILSSIGLISLQQVSSPIFHRQEKIGILKGKRYNRYVYPLTKILIIQFFLVITFLFILYLIFNRRLLEQQVLERTRRYHELVNLLPEMVIETDASGVITFANQKARDSFGIAASETTCTYRDVIHFENQEDDRILLPHSLTEETSQCECEAKSSNGVLFPVLVRSAPIFVNGKLKGARIVIVDITERSALEEQLSRDQKMKTIGMMAGGVAHDLNNILSAIVNYPELMLQHIPPGSPLVRMTNQIKEAGLRAAAVVADLLTVARGIAASRTIANLNEIVKDYLDSPEFRKLQSIYPDITYKTVLSDDTDNISCSIIHIKKCLMNLVTNASEAVSGSGKVTITSASKKVEKTITTHSTIPPGKYSILSIEDTGTGISDHDLQHIFEPFYSKKELGRSGTGLGLSVVWNTIHDHNGGINVRSGRDGSVFELYFPQSLAKRKEKKKGYSSETLTGNGESILIIDDEYLQRDIASQFLSSLGYSVHAVSSGREALEYLRHNNADLILLDMVLESEMNGMETFSEIIRLNPNQKAIIISGFSESDDVRKTMKMGASILINKPYTKKQLAEAVHLELVGNE